MKNAPFYALVGVVAIVIGLIVLAIFLQAIQGELPENTAGGICMVIFLIIATIGYELVMKPGLYSKRKAEEEVAKEETSESNKEGGEEKPGSP